jgi:DNA-binding LacI/PurR family transcriptional regulator
MIETSSISKELRKALVLLETEIEQCRTDSNARLHTVKELAARAHVSSATMQKAVNIKKGQGVITARQKQGLQLSAAHNENSGLNESREHPIQNSPRHSPRWISLRKQLFDDMLDGVYSPGTALPAGKELCARYGVCYATLAKSIGMLVKEKKLIPWRKGYRVYVAPSVRSRSTIILILYANPSSESALSPQGREFWRQLEFKCIQIGISIITVNGNEAAKIVREVSSSAFPVLGYIFMTHLFLPEDIEAVCSYLDKTQVPVTVLDEANEPSKAILYRYGALFRFFSITSGIVSGKLMGEYLLSQGHRRIGIFSIFPDEAWPRNRMAGVESAFSQAGLHANIVRFAHEDPKVWQLWRQVHQGSYSRQVEEFQINILRELYSFLAIPADLLKGYAPLSLVYESLFAGFLRGVMIPLFRSALSSKDISAWVCINDIVGIIALDVLEQEHVAVPAPISVVAFDDTLHSLTRGLTSYNFNVPGLIASMLSHILEKNPGKKKSDQQSITEVNGLIMERRSSRLLLKGSRPTIAVASSQV